MNKKAVLSFIFTVIAFIIYFKVFQYIGNLFPIHALMNIVAIFLVIIILIPASVFTGNKVSEYFMDN